MYYVVGMELSSDHRTSTKINKSLVFMGLYSPVGKIDNR